MKSRQHPMNPEDRLDQCRFSVSMDTTSQCNLRCRHCWISAVVAQGYILKSEIMPLDLFRKISGDFRGICSSFALSCAYEPLLNQQFDQYLKVAVEDEHPDIHFFTNGKLLRKPMADQIVGLGADRVIFSIESVDPDGFKDIRRGAQLEDLTRGLDLINEVKQATGSEKPEIHLNWVPMPRNMEELPELAEFAARHRCAGITLIPHVRWEMADLEESSLGDWPPERVLEQVNGFVARCRELGVAVQDKHLKYLIPDVTETLGQKLKSSIKGKVRDMRSTFPYCMQPWDTIMINPAGRIVPCSGTLFDGISEGFADKSLEEIWNGEDYSRLRDQLKGKRQACSICRECSSFGPNAAKADYRKFYQPRVLDVEYLRRANSFIEPKRKVAAVK